MVACDGPLVTALRLPHLPPPRQRLQCVAAMFLKGCTNSTSYFLSWWVLVSWRDSPPGAFTDPHRNTVRRVTLKICAGYNVSDPGAGRAGLWLDEDETGCMYECLV
jgi:hypothetical protein